MSDGPMDQKAKDSIWLQFQDLLPRTLDSSIIDDIVNRVRVDGNTLNDVYEAAIYAGYCRGWAEGDGAHRKRSSDPWCWMDGEDNDLDSMSEEASILITARQLRSVIADSFKQGVRDLLEAQWKESREHLPPLGMVEVRTFVPEEIADKVRSGEIGGYSMGGVVRRPVLDGSAMIERPMNTTMGRPPCPDAPLDEQLDRHEPVPRFDIVSEAVKVATYDKETVKPWKGPDSEDDDQ